MKKNLLSAVLATLICVTMIFTLGACDKAPSNGDVSGTSMEGKWVLSGMIMGGQDYVAMMKSMLGDAFDVESMMTCEFKGDGTFVMVMQVPGEDMDTTEGTYAVNGSSLVLSVEGDEPVVATIDGDTFTMVNPEDGGETTSITFKRK